MANNDKVKIEVRGVDRDLWRRAKAKAVEQEKTYGQFISEALAEKLARSLGYLKS